MRTHPFIPHYLSEGVPEIEHLFQGDFATQDVAFHALWTDFFGCLFLEQKLAE